MGKWAESEERGWGLRTSPGFGVREDGFFGFLFCGLEVFVGHCCGFLVCGALVKTGEIHSLRTCNGLELRVANCRRCGSVDITSCPRA